MECGGEKGGGAGGGGAWRVKKGAGGQQERRGGKGVGGNEMERGGYPALTIFFVFAGTKTCRVIIKQSTAHEHQLLNKVYRYHFV